MSVNGNVMRIAVLHTFVEFNARKKNIDRVSSSIERALHYEERIKMVILPQMVNGIALYEEIAGKGVKISGETIPGPTIEELVNVSRKFNASLLVGPILERRGSKLYRSTTFISGSEVKSVVRQITARGRISGYRGIPYIDLNSSGIGIYIADDIFYPEIALIFSIINPSITIFFPSIESDIVKQQLMARARALESRSVTIMVGGIYTYKQEIMGVVPTIVLDEEGDEVERVDKVDERIIVLNVNVKLRPNHVVTNERKRILKILKRLLH
uniref:CN hydrolase domain-containing protein n=1 Tax=Ignisphaera aggregans TaxID=334771 RepID=A0A7C4FED0_9CREN